MRVCWNRQTGTFEGRVSKDVWVQVPLLAPSPYLYGKEIFYALLQSSTTNSHITTKKLPNCSAAFFAIIISDYSFTGKSLCL